MDREKETAELRAWLLEMREVKYALRKIAARAEVTPKTVYMIINNPEHVAQPSTIKALQLARRWFERTNT